jgi:hypothetical protein
MRSYGALNPLGTIPLPPDTVQTLLIAGSSGQASTGRRHDRRRSLDIQPRRLPRRSRVLHRPDDRRRDLNFMVNLCSTHAAVPSSGTSVTTGTTGGSTGNNIPVIGEAIFQIPPWSTGWSVAALSSGYVMAQVWRK